MEKPVEVSEGEWRNNYFYRMMIPSRQPRLELYIGDINAVPFLQERLEGWRYLQLAELLGYNLPITESLRKKIEDEQLDIFDAAIGFENHGWKTEEMIRTAVERSYHKNGAQLTRPIAPGVEMHIDLRKFFAEKKKEFRL